MPWTRQQVKFLLDKKVSPLTSTQRSKMVGELHADPKMGHVRKGSKELKKNG
jgi:hypothetical protein